MLEQEIASLMRYTIDKAGNPSPYYHDVPQDFLVPAVYFPPPELSSRGDTLLTYALEYSLFVKFFCSSTQQAMGLGMAVLTSILSGGSLIPLIGEDGALGGKGFYVKDPRLRSVDGAGGAAQLELAWDSPRPYNMPQAQKMMTLHLDMYSRGSYMAAVERMENTEGGNPHE